MAAATTLALTGLASAGGSLLGGLGGGGGSSTPTPVNAGTRALNSIFGKSLKSQRPGDIFGTEGEFSIKDWVENYLRDPATKIPGTDINLWDSVLGGPTGIQDRMSGFFTGMENAVGTANELTSTGIPTDGSAYFDEAIRKLRTEVTPGLAETSGFGTQGSGFLQGGYQASQDLLGQAALANIDLQEAATNRRMQSAPLLATLLTAQNTVPANIGTMLASVFEAERNKPMALFEKLYSMSGNPGSFTQKSFNPTDPGSGFSAAMTGLSGILSSLGGFNFGGTTGGGDNFLNSLYTLGGPGY